MVYLTLRIPNYFTHSIYRPSSLTLHQNEAITASSLTAHSNTIQHFRTRSKEYCIQLELGGKFRRRELPKAELSTMTLTSCRKCHWNFSDMRSGTQLKDRTYISTTPFDARLRY